MERQALENEKDSREAILQNRQQLQGIDTVQWHAMSGPSPTLACEFRPETCMPSSWDRRHQHEGATSSTVLSVPWQRRHVGIDENTWTRPDPGLRFKSATCLASNFCSCGRGQRLTRAWHSRLRSYTPKLMEDVNFKARVTHGEVIFWFRSERPEAQQALPAASSSEAVHIPGASTLSFFYVCLMYMSPWRPTLARLDLVRPSAAELNLGHGGGAGQLDMHFCATIKESGTVDICSIWQALSGLDLNCQVEVGTLLLLTTHEPLPRGNYVVARENRSVNTCILWKGLTIELQAAQVSEQPLHRFLVC